MDNICTHCGSKNIVFDRNYGFYRCNDCSKVWAYHQDDPDYDEIGDPDLEDALLEQILGSGRMTFL